MGDNPHRVIKNPAQTFDMPGPGAFWPIRQIVYDQLKNASKLRLIFGHLVGEKTVVYKGHHALDHNKKGYRHDDIKGEKNPFHAPSLFHASETKR